MDITPEYIQKKAEGALRLLEDGFQFSDLMAMVPMVMEIARDAQEAETGAERFELAVALGNYIIDKTDVWGFDFIADPICKKILPHAVQLAFDCAEGQHNFTPEAPEA